MSLISSCRTIVVIVSTLSVAASAHAGEPKPPAAAQSPDAERAARLKKLGDEALLGARYSEALRYYDESLRVAPNPALHYNRGRALEALDRVPEAVDAYDTFLGEAPPELRTKTPTLGEHVEELRRKTTRLTVNVDVEGARVLLRGVVVGTTPLKPMRVLAGAAPFEVEAEGFNTHRADLQLHGGDDTTVRVHLVPRASAAARASAGAGAAASSAALAPEPARAPEAPPEGESKGVLRQWWFWTGVGVVVAGGATALVIALSNKSEPEARSGTLGTVSGPLMRF